MEFLSYFASIHESWVAILGNLVLVVAISLDTIPECENANKNTHKMIIVIGMYVCMYICMYVCMHLFTVLCVRLYVCCMYVSAVSILNVAMYV